MRARMADLAAHRAVCADCEDWFRIRVAQLRTWWGVHQGRPDLKPVTAPMTCAEGARLYAAAYDEVRGDLGPRLIEREGHQ